MIKDIKFAKIVIFINALVPLALLLWDAWQGKLGANPQEFALRTTGFLTLIFLLITLAVTPLRKLTGMNELIKFRRELGLFAFFYSFLHFTTYIWFDREFNLSSTAADIVQRPFIAVGMAAFFMLIPLAVTSTNSMIKRLGGKRWQQLHKLTYLIAIAGVLHYYMIVKTDVIMPLAFAAVTAILLGYRVYANNQKPVDNRKTSVVPK
jgi:methionine sulfoxide reductase heme-binding subunit